MNLRYVFVSFYVILFAAYIIIGLQPAEAVVSYDISGNLSIPEIDLNADVTQVSLEGGNLETPDTIVGSYSKAVNKTLLFGHSTTVFQDLKDVQVSDKIIYNDVSYHVVSNKIWAKSDITMSRLLRGSDVDTLVLMTCAGELLGDGDATHRLIVVAIKD